MSDATGPAVLGGLLRYVSVSQVERFDATCDGGCPAKWWFRYVGRVPEEAKAAAKLGTQVHAQIEYYLRTGVDMLGELARSALRFMPAPMTAGPGLRVELGIGAPLELLPGGVAGPMSSPLTMADVPVVGFLDVLDERDTHKIEDPATGDAVEVTEPGVPEVNDWKTHGQVSDTLDGDGNLVRRGYAKTAAQLRDTHQMASYGELVRRVRPGVRGVRLSHTAIQTKGPRLASKRSCVVHVDDVVRRFARSEAVVEDMKRVARMTDVASVPKNYRACGAYGGCAYRSVCPRDPKAVMAEVFAGARRRPAPVDVSKKENVMSLLDRVNAKKAAAPAANPVNPAVAAARAAILAEEAALRAGVTPPDVPEASDVALPPDEDMLVGSDGGCPVGGTQRELDVDAVATRKYACVCGDALKVKPTKLGDGKYYALVPKHGEVAATPAPAPAKVADLVYTGTKVAETAAAPLLTLLLDVAVDGVAAQRLETYAQAKANEISKQFCDGKTDIRCAPGDSPIAFGKWKGALATLVQADPPPSGVYAVSSSSEFGMVTFEALAYRAQVYRSMK